MIQDLRHIRAFLVLAQARSFTRAAAELHMSQPTLTVQIQQLESAVGVKLFDRNKRHVALTQAGRELMVPLERLLLDVEAIAASTEELLEHRRGLVTVAGLPSMTATLLPRAIHRLAQSYPGITVRVQDGVAGTVATLVKTGQVDFGISSLTGGDRDLTSQVLLMDRLCAVVPANHVLARKQSTTIGELARYPLVVNGKDSSARQVLDQGFDREGLVPTVAYEATYASTVSGMTRAGLGVGILPESLAGPSGLRCLSIRNGAMVRKIGIVMRAGRSLSPTADKLKQVIEQVARSLQRRPGARTSA